MVRAKFKVTRFEVQRGSKARVDEQGKHVQTPSGAYIYDPCEQRTIVMHPVYDNTPDTENTKFCESTPSGELRLGTLNPNAWDFFELEKEYYIDFKPVV